MDDVYDTPRITKNLSDIHVGAIRDIENYILSSSTALKCILSSHIVIYDVQNAKHVLIMDDEGYVDYDDFVDADIIDKLKTTILDSPFELHFKMWDIIQNNLVLEKALKERLYRGALQGLIEEVWE